MTKIIDDLNISIYGGFGSRGIYVKFKSYTEESLYNLSGLYYNELEKKCLDNIKKAKVTIKVEGEGGLKNVLALVNAFRSFDADTVVVDMQKDMFDTDNRVVVF